MVADLRSMERLLDGLSACIPRLSIRDRCTRGRRGAASICFSPAVLACCGRTDMVPSRHLASSEASRRWFVTTNWTLVLQASDTNSPEAASALGHLCHVYWAPVNAFIRHITHCPTNAEDLTQQFFAQFL